MKNAFVLLLIVSLVIILFPQSTHAQDPIPKYGNNVAYLGSYTGYVEEDEQYLTADINQVGERGDNTTNSEWFHIFPHAGAIKGSECKVMYFYQQPATDDLLYFDTTKDVEIIVHAEFDDTLVNLTAELQYGRDQKDVVFGRDTNLNEDGDDYYEFNIRITEEVLENHISLVLFIYYNVSVTQSFEGTIHTEGSSTVTYPLLPPPEGDDDETPDDDDNSDDDASDDDTADDELDYDVDDNDVKKKDSPGFGILVLIAACTFIVWGFRNRRRRIL